MNIFDNQNGLIASYNGMPIITSPSLPEFVPVIELSHKVDVSPEFRAKSNARYLELFGKKAAVYMMSGKMAVHPKTLERLKIVLEKDNGTE